LSLSFFKKNDQSKHKKKWLNQKELSHLRVLAEQLNTSATPNNKQQAQHSGQLNSHRLGSGSDYAESRPYQMGDDPRSINWRLSARSQETFVKTYYADSRPSLNILLDQRKSMVFGTRKRLKISQALRVALLLSNAGEVHGLDFKGWVINDTSLDFFDNSDDFLINANQAESSQNKVTQLSLNAAFKQILPQLTEGSLFYLISDFAGVEKSQLSALVNHCAVQAIQVLDPAEISLQNIACLSLEDGRGMSIEIDTQNKSQEFNLSNKIKEIQEDRKKIITDLNINYSRIMTNADNIHTEVYLPIKSAT